MTPDAFYRLTELDRTNWSELGDQVLHFAHEVPLGEPRLYPGYPRWPLDAVRARLWPSLDRVLGARRCVRRLSTELPSRRTLSRLLYFAHGSHDTLELGAGTGAGALIGGLVGGGKGLLIGAAIGAGGTVTHWLSKKNSAYLPAGSEIIFELSRPMTVTASAPVPQHTEGSL